MDKLSKYRLWLVVTLVIGLVMGIRLVGQKVWNKPKAAEIFSDGFERINPINKDWIMTSGNENQITSTTNQKYSGGYSLSIYNSGSDQKNGGGLQALDHYLSPATTGTFGVWLYDPGLGTPVDSTVSVSNNDQYLIMGMESVDEYYFYRTPVFRINTYVKRTAGWHWFELVVTPRGTFGKIDGQSQAAIGCDKASVNPDVCVDAVVWNLRTVNKMSLARGHSVAGYSYFDEVKIDQLSPVPATTLAVFENWIDESYRIYGNTNTDAAKGPTYKQTVDSLLDGAPGENNVIRAGLAKAQMHLYFYEKNKNPIDLEISKYIIDRVIYHYPAWGKTWLSSQSAVQLGYTAWWIWPELSVYTRSEVYRVLMSEADYWNWAWNQIENKPRENTVQENNVTDVSKPYVENIALVTDKKPLIIDGSWLIPPPYTEDTKAEESGSSLQLLSMAEAMFGNNPTSNRWGYASDCFAFHTLTADPGETKCNVTTRTMTADHKLGNHGWLPHLGYTTAAVSALQQSRFNYVLANKYVPDSLFHNIDKRMQSTVWINNVSYCTDENNMIKPPGICHKGEDWGDTNNRIISLVLPYWQKLDKDVEAENKLNDLSNYYWNLYGSLLTKPVKDPVKIFSSNESGVSNSRMDAFINLERHAQLSAKLYVLDRYQDNVWRQNHFPYFPKIAEDNVFRNKLWSGNSGSVSWNYDSAIKDINSIESVHIKATNWVDFELYSPLIEAKPGAKYTVSYKVKTVGLVKNTAGIMGRLIIGQYNNQAEESGIETANRVESGMQYGTNVSGTTNGWVNQTYSFITKPETKYIRMRMFLGGGGTAKGEVWFDTIKVVTAETYVKTACSAVESKFSSDQTWLSDIGAAKHVVEAYTTRKWNGDVQEVVYTKGPDANGYVWLRTGIGSDVSTLKGKVWNKYLLSTVWSGTNIPSVKGGITGALYFLEAGKMKEVIISGNDLWWRSSLTVGGFDLPATWNKTTTSQYWQSPSGLNCPEVIPVGGNYVSSIRALDWKKGGMMFEEMVAVGSDLYIRKGQGDDRAAATGTCFEKNNFSVLWSNANPPTLNPKIIDYQMVNDTMREVVVDNNTYYYRDCTRW